jgi:hypothetical protein
MELRYSLSDEILEAILFGLRIFIPILFLVKILKLRPGRIDLDILIEATNICMLLTGLYHILSLLPFAKNVYVDWYSGYNYTQYVLLDDTLYSFMFVPRFIFYAVFPQLMWFGKLRRVIHVSFIIVCFWWLSYLHALIFFGVTDLKIGQTYTSPAHHILYTLLFSIFITVLYQGLKWIKNRRIKKT